MLTVVKRVLEAPTFNVSLPYRGLSLMMTLRIFDCKFSHISRKNDNIPILVCHLSVVEFRWSMMLCDWSLAKNRISHWLRMTRDLEMPTETQYAC